MHVGFAQNGGAADSPHQTVQHWAVIVVFWHKRKKIPFAVGAKYDLKRYHAGHRDGQSARGWKVG